MKRARRIRVFVVMTLLVLAISASTALPVLACDGDCCHPKCYPVGTPGYWMNHPDAWTVEVFNIGPNTYTKAEAIAIMKAPVKRDKTYTMFPALVAAMLNAYSNCYAYNECVRGPGGAIAEGKWWLSLYPVGSDVRGSDEAWQYSHGEAIYLMLDDYNNGRLCAPSRD